MSPPVLALLVAIPPSGAVLLMLLPGAGPSCCYPSASW